MVKKKTAAAPVAGKKSTAPVHPESAQGNKLPLWKQYQQSQEYADYKENQLPKDKKKMDALIKQIEADKLEKQRIKERDDQMAKEFQLRWVDAQSGKVLESKHGSQKAAQDKARDLSLTNSPVQVGEVDGGKLLQQWNYEKGKQQAMDTKKQVSVVPISKKEASQIKTNEVKGSSAMAKKPAGKPGKTLKSGQVSKGSKAQEAPTGAGKAKSQPLAKSSGQEPKKTGTIRDQFGLREGSNRAKLVDCLLEAKGKPVPISALLKAVYGSPKEEGKGPLAMVLKGTQDMIDKNKIKMEIIRAKDDKGVTIALKAK